MFLVGWVFYALITSQVTICRTYSIERSQYECGAHGKFEYCIDGIPGCVIGCHCHPGFYFDTDTKICEPNTKLTENFQQRQQESSRRYTIYTSRTENIPTPTTTNILDESVDANSIVTDDLSNWLYNQFFKTIEAQIINNTNDKPPTRRRGNDVFQPRSDTTKETRAGRKSNNYTTKRKARKSLKKRGKKRKSHVDSLRRKLLRITEDDSLFDSSDSDGNDSSDSSSSSSSEISKESKKDRSNDREHGHKKVIMFNRRPRPPLPSFIILPSMDTPYYPPIGLPPPPVLPMYPLIPIPPMAPKLSSLEQSSNTSTTLATITTKHDGSPGSTADSVSLHTESITTASSHNTSNGALRSKIDKHTKPKISENKKLLNDKCSEEKKLIQSKEVNRENPIGIKQAEWIKLLQKLKAKLKMKNNIPLISDVVDDVEEGAHPSLNYIQTVQELSSYKPKDRIPKDKDVKLNDFKYLTELIHRVNLSDLKPANKIIGNNVVRNLGSRSNIRRRYNQQPSHIDYEATTMYRNSDDIYFMNLGRQIASLIRATDSQLSNDDYLAKRQNNYEDSTLSIIPENRYPSHSFWDRSARSPIGRLKNYFASLNNHKDINENNLLSLEDEVNTFASTVPPMSLQEIENILNTLQSHEMEMKKYNNIMQQSNNTLDVDLFPSKPMEIESLYKTLSERAKSNISQRRKLENINDTKHPAKSNVSYYLNYTDMDDWKVLNKEPLSKKETSQQNYPELLSLKPIKHKTLISENPNHYKRLTPYFPVGVMVEKKSPKIPPEEYSVYPKGVPEMNTSLKRDQLQKIFYKLHEYPSRFIKYPSVSHKYSYFTEKDHDLAPKYNLTINYPTILTKHSDQNKKAHELSSSSHDLAIKYSKLPSKYHKLPNDKESLDDRRAKYIEKTTTYHNQLQTSDKLSGIPKKYIFLAENESLNRDNELSNLTMKHFGISSKFPELFAKYSKHVDIANFPGKTRTNPELTANYPSKSTIFNYKKRNLFPDISSKGQYIFEASFPIRTPNYRRIFSKGVEFPSYVHHELHHFDYFI